MKAGRNDPCPCGSGKKHKKCCLGLDHLAPRPPPSVDITAPMATEGRGKSNRVIAETMAQKGIRMSPYALARMTESSDALKAIEDPVTRAAVERGMRDAWTRAKVAAMTTEALEAEFLRVGVRYSRDEFRALTTGRRSAWTIAEVWRERDPVTCRGRDEDLLGLAACELWKRLTPAEPSTEMLDDWMQEGYELAARGDVTGACDRWWRLWCLLTSRFDSTMCDVHDTEEAFLGYQSIFNWCQEFERHLENAARHDRYYAALGRRYCDEFLDQFTEADVLLQVNFRRALAAFLFDLGDAVAGEETLREIVSEWPTNVWGYVALADAWSHGGPRAMAPQPDIAQARAWLERGLNAVPREDRNRDVLLQWLKRLAEAPSPRAAARSDGGDLALRSNGVPEGS